VKSHVIVTAVKQVSAALLLSSGGKRIVSASSVIKGPSTSRIADKEMRELKQYIQLRNQEKVLIATMDPDTRKYLDIPYLEVSCQDLNGKDFSGGMGDILLEPKGCIFFQTKNLSKEGF
jgi:hypothetical protein